MNDGIRACNQERELGEDRSLSKTAPNNANKGDEPMTCLKKFLMTGLAGGCVLLASHAAQAMNAPSNIQIDGGPLGQLEISGGVSGYFFGQTGTSNSGGSLLGDRSTGANLDAALIELQKTSGILQFTIEVGPVSGTPILGTKPETASVTVFRASPIYQGYVTLAPKNSPITISVGQLTSLEGYEGLASWGNANLFLSDLFYVENSSSVGVSGTYTKGPFTLTATFSDGWDTRVFNFLQTLATYSFNKNSSLNLYYAGNLSRTGLNTITYDQTSTQNYGAYLVNSQMFGGFYSWTHGNLNLVPEVQYVYAKPDQQLGIPKFTSNFGTALFGDYSFANTPYSLGSMAEYFVSNGPSNWFIAPHAAGFGLELSPTWQYKDLYARLSVGYLHLTNTGGAGYGSNGNGRNVLQSALEGGVLF